MATTMLPMFVTRNQLRALMLSRRQAREDMRHGKSLSLRCAARDAYTVFGMRIRAELQAHARQRYAPMPEYLRDAIGVMRVNCN